VALEILSHLEPLVLEHPIQRVLVDVLLQLVLSNILGMLVCDMSACFKVIFNALNAFLDGREFNESLLLFLYDIIFEGQFGFVYGRINLIKL
jgi:hypothetical protein